MENRTSFTKKLCVTAVLIALGSVLSLIKVFEMPLGGSVTLLSMLPIVMIPLMYAQDGDLQAHLCIHAFSLCSAFS